MYCTSCGAALAHGETSCPRCTAPVPVRAQAAAQAGESRATPGATREIPQIREPARGIYDQPDMTSAMRNRSSSVTEQLWPAGSARPQRESIARDSRPVVMVIAVALFTLAGAGLIFGLLLNLGGPSSAPPPTLAQPTDTPSVSEEPKKPSPSKSSIPGLPSGAKSCNDAAGTYSAVYVGNSTTSCPFAKAVLAAYAKANPTPKAKTTVTAKSPVTKKKYKLNCVAGAGGVISCTGGKNALILLLSK